VARAALERAEQSEMSRVATTVIEPAAPENAAKGSVPASKPPDVASGASPEPVANNEQNPPSTEATPQCSESPVPTCVGKASAATDRDPSTEEPVADDDLEVYDRLLGGGAPGGAAKPKAGSKKKAVGHTSSGVAFILGNAAAADPWQRISQLEAQNKEMRKLLTDSDREDETHQDGDAEAALPNGQAPAVAETLHARAKRLERAAVSGCRRKHGLRQADKALRMFTRLLLRNPVVLWIFYTQLLLLWSIVVLRQA